MARYLSVIASYIVLLRFRIYEPLPWGVSIPQTGRKHQLRRHMKHIFHPILGDTQYGDLHQNRALTEHSGCQRLFLHADTLIFEHPVDLKKIEIKASLDEQWIKVMELFNWSI